MDIERRKKRTGWYAELEQWVKRKTEEAVGCRL
jgi:hypothetical protein